MQAPPWENPATIGESIDLVSALAALLKRWPFLLASTVAGLLLASLIALLMPKVFRAKAVFLPPTQQMPAIDSPLAMFWKPQSSAIYPGLLESDSVLSDVIEHADLLKIYHARDMEIARTRLRRETAITTDAAGFVTLAVSDHDPRLAKEIADKYLLALGRVNDRLVVEEASQRRKVFQFELQKEENELENAEMNLKRVQEASGVVSPQTQTEAGLRSIDAVRAQIRVQQVNLAAMLQGQTDQSPDVVRARSEIAALEGQLLRLQTGAGGAAGAGLTAAHAPEVNLEFIRLERQVKYHQLLLDTMMRQFENAKQQETTAAPGVQVVDYPEIPIQKSGPKRTLIAIAGAVLGFLAGLVTVFVRNRWSFLNTSPERTHPMQVLRGALRQGTLRP